MNEERFAAEAKKIQSVITKASQKASALSALSDGGKMSREKLQLTLEETAYFFELADGGTASMMDQFIVVIEPGARSVQTYERIKSLAKDIGITKVRVVANKIRDDSDREFIRSRIPADDLLGFISYNPDVIDADRKGLSPYDCSPQALEEIRAIKARIDQE